MKFATLVALVAVTAAQDDEEPACTFNAGDCKSSDGEGE